MLFVGLIIGLGGVWALALSGGRTGRTLLAWGVIVIIIATILRMAGVR